MATGRPPWDYTFKAIDRSFRGMIKPYSGWISQSGTQIGWVTFYLTIAHGGTEVKRSVGPFDINAKYWQVLEKKIAAALVDAINEAKLELMDPHGEMKTISVKEVYADVR